MDCVVSVPRALKWLGDSLLGRVRRTRGSDGWVGFKPLQIYLLRWMDGWLSGGLQLGWPHETTPLYSKLLWFGCYMVWSPGYCLLGRWTTWAGAALPGELAQRGSVLVKGCPRTSHRFLINGSYFLSRLSRKSTGFKSSDLGLNPCLLGFGLWQVT